MTKLISLCRCSVLYHPKKLTAHALAAWRSSKGRVGYSRLYFAVQNSHSENGLSFDTLGRPMDAAIPISCSFASIVAPFMGDPLSECSSRLSATTRCT